MEHSDTQYKIFSYLIKCTLQCLHFLHYLAEFGYLVEAKRKPSALPGSVVVQICVEKPVVPSLHHDHFLSPKLQAIFHLAIPCGLEKDISACFTVIHLDSGFKVSCESELMGPRVCFIPQRITARELRMSPHLFYKPIEFWF